MPGGRRRVTLWDGIKQRLNELPVLGIDKEYCLSLSLYKANEYTVNYTSPSTCQGVRGGQLSDWILDTVERVGSVSTKLEICERRAERDKCGEWGDCETCITDLGQPVPLHWGKRLSQFFLGRRQRVWWTEARLRWSSVTATRHPETCEVARGCLTERTTVLRALLIIA